MKYLVGAVMIIYVLFMGSTVTYGFFQKQQKEAELKNTTQTPQSGQNQPAASEQPAQPSTPAPTSPALTVAEVAKHNKATDCWIIINSKVYDVGKFLDIHPGSADVIVPFCGKDATQAFNTKGGKGKHADQATQELQNHLLGPLQ